MSLSDLKNKLYKKDTDSNAYQYNKSKFDAPPAKSDFDSVGNNFSADSKDAWLEPSEADKKKKIIKISVIVGGAILLLVVIFITFWKIRQSSFDEGRVFVTIQGLDEVRSGKLVAYEITYKNNNRAALRNATLRLTYPEDFRPEENLNYKEEGPTVGNYYLGNIEPNSEEKIIFNSRTYNPSGNLIYLKAELDYVPSNFSSHFLAKTQYGINIASTPITLEIMAPQAVASGDAVDYLVSYKNISGEDYETLRIKLEYPNGFTYTKSAPLTSEGNDIWYIGHLSAGQEGKITISGKLEGENKENKTVKALIGMINQGRFLSYTEESAETSIAASPLVIAQTANGLTNLNVNPGDTLNYEIMFRNDMEKDAKDLIVTEKIDSSVLDYTTLDLGKGGYFDQQNKTITWKALDSPGLSQLGAGQSNSLKFSIKVKNILPIASGLDKNFVISSEAKIDSPDIPTVLEENKIISGNKLDIKLNTKLVLESIGLYRDEIIQNSGPIPPIAGQETTYAIHWRVMNVSNDVMDAKVRAVLPTNVSLTGKIVPEDSNLVVDERNNTVTWDIGSISAGTGIITEAKQVAFQIKLTPLPGQVGESPQIIGPAIFTAKDLFTTQDLETSIKEKTTVLTEDPAIQYGYRVRAE